MDWNKNFLDYALYKKTGTRPHCKSDQIQVEEYQNNRRSSLTFICKDCGKWAHIDGVCNQNNR